MDSNKRRKMGQNSFMEDLITEIISRVPTKHLLRFSCVSKSWCYLIRTDPYFSRLHRAALQDRPCLVIREINSLKSLTGWSPYKYCDSYWIDLESVEGQTIHIRKLYNPPSEDHDNGFTRWDTCVLASCHDFVVLRIHHHPNKYAVSNPITGTHIMVPPNPAGDDNVVFFGFGYDRIHDCYKLLTRVKHCDQTLELIVYDLDKGTWKRLQFGMPWKSQFQDNDSDYLYRNAKCIDGGLYWSFYMGKPWKMVCFLLAEEEFHVLKPPDHSGVIGYNHNTMTVFDGKLGLVYKTLGLNTRHEFWSVGMGHDDDGKRQWRWTKLFAISNAPSYRNVNDFLTPVCFSACKNKILIFSRMESQLFWYDIVKKKFNKLNNPINERCQEGQLFSYDMVRKKVHNLNNPIDGESIARIQIK